MTWSAPVEYQRHQATLVPLAGDAGTEVVHDLDELSMPLNDSAAGYQRRRVQGCAGARGEVAFDAPEGPLLVDWSPGLEGPTAIWRVTG